jgi:hypothetical protein
MMSRVEYRERDGSFDLLLPTGWEAERDESGGVLLASDGGCGLLHVIPFEREAGEEADPGEELYAFLEDQQIELEEDEVEDFDLAAGGALALCEYLAEEDDQLIYWMVGVATAPGQLLFASYSCPAGEEERESGLVRDILSTVTFVSAR